MFRVSFGLARCEGFERRTADERALCEAILAKLEWLRALSPDQLVGLKEADSEKVNAAGKEAFVSVYKEEMPNGYLFVVQGFVPTWRFPTFLSFSKVGKLFVEGLLLKEGSLSQASDDLLWRYK